MKKITINDIAKLAGVSKTTVSFYLNGMYEKMSEDTRKQIEKVIEKTGYQPSVIARGLNAKSNKLIGVIIGDVTNSFANKVINGIELSCKERGYKSLLVSSYYSLDNEKQYLQFLHGMNVDGFIVQPTVGFEALYKNIVQDKPLVVFDSPTMESENSWVKTDSKTAVYDLVHEMIKEGYHRFVYVTADPYVLYTRKERYDGFMKAVEENNLPKDIIVYDEDNPSMIDKLEPLILSDEPIGIIVANNWLLKMVYQELDKYFELMPEHIGLAGFDSLEWSSLARPSVTTIVQPAFEEGQAAASMLIDLIENKKTNQETLILPCYLNRKETTNKSGKERE